MHTKGSGAPESLSSSRRKIAALILGRTYVRAARVRVRRDSQRRP
jgi:hypothetical protein